MNAFYHLQQEKYNRQLAFDLLRKRLWNPILFLAWMEALQVIYSISKFGRLRKNLPVLLLLGLFFLGVLIQYLDAYAVRRRKRPIQEGQGIVFTTDGFDIMEGDQTVSSIPWTDVFRIRKKKGWYYLDLNHQRFMPLPAAVFDETIPGMALELHKSSVPQKKILLTWLPVSIWLLVTLAGIFAVGRTAVNFNGKLAWYLMELDSRRAVTMKSDNLYEDGLEGILDTAQKKIDFMPYMMASSLSVHFHSDGTMKSFDAFILGYDINYKLKKSYQLSYQAAQSRKLQIYVDDYEGIRMPEEEQYQPDRDFRYIREIFEKVALKERVWADGGDGYGFSFKLSGSRPSMRLYEEATDRILDDYYLTDYPYSGMKE